MIGEMQPWHWAIVIAVAIMLFGAKRLPEGARALGRSVRILKAELTPTTHPDADSPRASTNPVSAAATASASAEHDSTRNSTSAAGDVRP